MQQTEEQYIGISGWLSPNGEFIPVPYGKHEEIALQLEYGNIVKPIIDSVLGRMVHGERLFELSGYIKFTCRLKGIQEYESYVFFPQQFGYTKSITNKQIEFLMTNDDKMTNLQKKYVKQYLWYSYGITA